VHGFGESPYTYKALLPSSHFETHVTDLVTQSGGRLVKFIGAEARFVIEDTVAKAQTQAQALRPSGGQAVVHNQS
jgi:hypothetical protein